MLLPAVIAGWMVICCLSTFRLFKKLHCLRTYAPLLPLFAFALFLLPIADEIIAIPEYAGLCNTSGYLLVVDEKSAQGRTLENASQTEILTLWPGTVAALKMNIQYVDVITRKLIIAGIGYVKPISSFLYAFTGRNLGKGPTALLQPCGLERMEARDDNGLPSRFAHLQLKVADNQ